MSGPAARIQNLAWRVPDVAESLQHALGNFPVQKLCAIKRATPFELGANMAGIDTQGRWLGHGGRETVTNVAR